MTAGRRCTKGRIFQIAPFWLVIPREAEGPGHLNALESDFRLRQVSGPGNRRANDRRAPLLAADYPLRGRQLEDRAQARVQKPRSATGPVVEQQLREPAALDHH